MEIRKSAVIGLGAIGTVYGSLLHKRYGGGFAVIAGGGRGEKLRSNGAVLNGGGFYPQVLEPGAEGFEADLVILCVKNYQLESALADIRGFVGEKTLFLPLLNGITARDRILSAYPENRVFYGLCIYIDAVRAADGVTNTADGIIRFGDEENSIPAQEALCVKTYLESAGIKTEIPEDMLKALWGKWMLNAGINQVSAVTGSAYGKMSELKSNRSLFLDAMLEVADLAKARGINLTQADALDYMEKLKSFSPLGKTSMLQDVESCRKTEVDYFGGEVARLGRKLGVPTPVNRVLHCIIKSLEANYGAD